MLSTDFLQISQLFRLKKVIYNKKQTFKIQTKTKKIKHVRKQKNFRKLFKIWQKMFTETSLVCF